MIFYMTSLDDVVVVMVKFAFDMFDAAKLCDPLGQLAMPFNPIKYCYQSEKVWQKSQWKQNR